MEVRKEIKYKTTIHFRTRNTIPGWQTRIPITNTKSTPTTRIQTETDRNTVLETKWIVVWTVET